MVCNEEVMCSGGSSRGGLQDGEKYGLPYSVRNTVLAVPRRNAQSLHRRIQGRRLHAQKFGGSAGSFYPPPCPFQYRQDVALFRSLQCREKSVSRGLRDFHV